MSLPNLQWWGSLMSWPWSPEEVKFISCEDSACRAVSNCVGNLWTMSVVQWWVDDDLLMWWEYPQGVKSHPHAWIHVALMMMDKPGQSWGGRGQLIEPHHQGRTLNSLLVSATWKQHKKGHTCASSSHPNPHHYQVTLCYLVSKWLPTHATLSRWGQRITCRGHLIKISFIPRVQVHQGQARLCSTALLTLHLPILASRHLVSQSHHGVSKVYHNK